MAGVSKVVYAVLAFVLIATGVYFAMQGTDNNGNCWSNYQTEEAAIMACEEH